jgi:hypothetical protein
VIKTETRGRQADDITADFKAFGFIFRGGSRPKTLNQRLGAVTNTEFANSDYIFRKACALADVPPSPRQASKYRNRRGIAYQFKGQATHE